MASSLTSLLVCLLPLVAPGVLQARAAGAGEPDREAKYQEMLAAKADPAAADWLALRFAYAEGLSFSLFAADVGRGAV